MTNLEETALREEFQVWVEKGVWQGEDDFTKNFAVGNVSDYWLAKMKARDSAERERINSRLAYMFANAPETYWAIKQIIYN